MVKIVSKLEMFREAAAAGETLDALDFVKEILDAMGGEAPSEVFKYLDRTARNSQAGAFLSGMSFHMRPEPTPGHRIKLLKKAAGGDDQAVARQALFAIASELLEAPTTMKKGVEALVDAANLGHGDAVLMLARAHEEGLYGLKVDIMEAYQLLAYAVDELDYPVAQVALADLIMMNEIEDSEYDPEELLEGAVEDEVDGAEERLTLLHMLKHVHGGKVQTTLGERVVPADISRPAAVVSAICNEIDVDPEEAQEIVAALYGFESWDELIDIASDPDSLRGRFDEDCSKKELYFRHQKQVTILQESLAAPDLVAEIMVELLRPTAKDAVPSLRRMNEIWRSRSQKQ